MQQKAAVSQMLMVADPYEADLVRRAKERSTEAWDEIYTRHYPVIYRYILARVFDPTTAEDLASATFVGAVRGMRSYKYQGQPLLAWLYRIARNVVSSHQRTIFRQRTLTLSAVLDLPGRVLGQTRRPEPAQSPASDPGTTVERLDLRNALAGLPDSQREVLVLKYYAGMDANEIAGVVGKEPAAVYSLQARGLQSLRRRLG
jgi:RNA polymerase sigma-70 factor (ECF subfamily)